MWFIQRGKTLIFAQMQRCQDGHPTAQEHNMRKCEAATPIQGASVEEIKKTLLHFLEVLSSMLWIWSQISQALLNFAHTSVYAIVFSFKLYFVSFPVLQKYQLDLFYFILLLIYIIYALH